jgi:hypothetical protein
LCRICDKENVTEIFFGTEDDADARFVFLFDCKHILESSGLDQWMATRFEQKNSNAENKNSIQLPEFPKCKTPIRSSLRYSYIQQQ